MEAYFQACLALNGSSANILLTEVSLASNNQFLDTTVVALVSRLLVVEQVSRPQVVELVSKPQAVELVLKTTGGGTGIETTGGGTGIETTGGGTGIANYWWRNWY